MIMASMLHKIHIHLRISHVQGNLFRDIQVDISLPVSLLSAFRLSCNSISREKSMVPKRFPPEEEAVRLLPLFDRPDSRSSGDRKESLLLLARSIFGLTGGQSKLRFDMLDSEAIVRRSFASCGQNLDSGPLGKE